jgi:hypothetical protein
MMLRGGCDSLVEHLLSTVFARGIEQLVAELLELEDDLRGHLDATPTS